MIPLLLRFGRRVRGKVASILPILVGSVVLLVIVTLAFTAIRGYLPANVRHILDVLQTGDLAHGRVLLRDMLESYGPAQHSVFLLIQVAQVLLAPIPAQLTGLLGGYLFGFWTGLGLAMSGLTIGSTLAITTSRLLGANVVRRIVPAAVFAQFDRLADESGVWGFLLIFLLPIFPGDSVCFIAGLTRLPMWQLVLASATGRLQAMAALTYIGASSEQHATMTGILLAMIVSFGIVLWLYSEEVEGWFRSRLGHSASSARG